MPPTPADWRSICRRTRTLIDTGTLPPGTPLPTIAGLAAETGLSIHGARRVYARLREEGRIVGWQGVGYRVATPGLEYAICADTRFRANVEGSGYAAETEVVAARTIRATGATGRALGLRAGARVIVVELIRRVERRPMILGLHHYAAERFVGIVEVLQRTGSVSQALRSHGVAEFRRRETRITTRLPSRYEALLLEIPRSQPVLVTSGINVDADGAVVELSCGICRGDQVSLRA